MGWGLGSVVPRDEEGKTLLRDGHSPAMREAHTRLAWRVTVGAKVIPLTLEVEGSRSACLQDRGGDSEDPL